MPSPARRVRHALVGVVVGLLVTGLGATDTRDPLLLGGLLVTATAAATLVAANPAPVLRERGSAVAAAFTAVSTLGAFALAVGSDGGFAYAPALLGLALAWLGFAAGVAHARSE
ncbi:hypothetical protein J2752_001026 [Halarchaeum rubridurum]|uniref:Uncharacterized protein n=1 Tax=Halarchaeum rubridurum TaxID=489911 RepID=A0A830FXU9_9EURY|nr:hypothetical protein [Halarchaeum rubridurum]MBP1954145.1 hypothetical protein [Halarchaeum rubridurum]GGM57719.1 hypothetical protein GCM10009017_04820 [Halarchaeum rubridurum]